jgi:hypothetical protein
MCVNPALLGHATPETAMSSPPAVPKNPDRIVFQKFCDLLRLQNAAHPSAVTTITWSIR